MLNFYLPDFLYLFKLNINTYSIHEKKSSVFL